MVSVDDLVISLRIEDTGNLGKLQKQLKALVGEKGEKQIDLGDLDPGIKRDIALIKDRIVKFTPTVLVGGNVKEAALSLATDLRTNKNLTDVMLQRYNINIDKYESFIEELLNIAMGISKMNSDQSKGFIAEMNKFRMIADMVGGKRETLVKNLTRMMLEAGFHEKLVDAFREAGVKMLSKPLMFELTKKSIGKGFKDVIKEAEIEEPKKFADLKEIFDKNSDMLKAISEAYEYMKDDVFDITEITQDMIENDKELRLIIIAQVASALKKSNWMFEQFYKAGKAFFTKGKAFGVAGAAQPDVVIHRFSKEALDQLGLEHVVGSKIDEATLNFLGELKTVAGKSEADYEITKRAIKQGYREMYFFVEEFTDGMKNYIEEFLSKEEHKGIKIGVYKILGRLALKLAGIAPDLDEMLRTAKESLEEEKEEEKELSDIDKEAIGVLKDIDDMAEDIGKQTTGSAEVISKNEAEEQRQMDEMMELLGNIKATGDDTNKEVKKKDDEPKIEGDQAED